MTLMKRTSLGSLWLRGQFWERVEATLTPETKLCPASISHFFLPEYFNTLEMLFWNLFSIFQSLLQQILTSGSHVLEIFTNDYLNLFCWNILKSGSHLLSLLRVGVCAGEMIQWIVTRDGHSDFFGTGIYALEFEVIPNIRIFAPIWHRIFVF